MQAIAADGTLAAFSDPRGFELRAAGGGTSPLALAIRRTPAIETMRQQRSVNVPYLTQHKDSALLQLENPRYRDAHGWDVDHKVLRHGDKSDTKNCALANVAMVNRFGGDLTQDRIGYEVMSDTAPR